MLENFVCSTNFTMKSIVLSVLLASAGVQAFMPSVPSRISTPLVQVRPCTCINHRRNFHYHLE